MKKIEQLFKEPANFSGERVVLVYHNTMILVDEEKEGNPIPEYSRIANFYNLSDSIIPIGFMNGIYYSALYVDNKNNVPGNTKFINVRHLYRTSNEYLFYLAGLGMQLAGWDRTNRFCGKCGSQMKNYPDERAKFCPDCRHIVYPKISPAMICAVTKDNKILLARGSKFSQPVYSVLAGFVETGESLEETVEREVMEEVGITIKNIKYFGNQSWPFSSSMMIAFTADYESGEIEIDNKEILDAGWFNADNLPMLPSSYSIARRLIEGFVEESKKGDR